MSLRLISDAELLKRTNLIVKKEKELLAQVIKHLEEVSRRKLFSSLGYKSLFDYGLKELGYSEGQIHRRIQAMRLVKEIPQIENKITEGSLSLSNISQAQSYFRESKPDKNQKLQLLQKLEGRSAREAQKIILRQQANRVKLPKEKQRIVSPSHSEISFVFNEEQLQKLEEVRSLLQPKEQSCRMSELIERMAELSIEKLKEKRFGKR